MAASSSSSSSSAQQDNHHRTGDTGPPRADAKQHRRHHLDHLEVQVPAVVPHNPAAGCFIGCFRPSPTSTTPSSSSPAAHSAHGNADRPASPSLIRSPTAWIRAFGSGNKHARRRSRDFQYDATSYARNFDEGGADAEGDEEAGLATGDGLKYRMFSSRLPTSPPAMSPSGLGPGKGMIEPAPRETGRDRE